MEYNCPKCFKKLETVIRVPDVGPANPIEFIPIHYKEWPHTSSRKTRVVCDNSWRLLKDIKKQETGDVNI